MDKTDITWDNYIRWEDSLTKEKQQELIDDNADDILDYLEDKDGN